MTTIFIPEKFEPTLQEKISCLTIRVLYGRFQSFPRDNVTQSNIPFHKAFLNAFTNDLPRNVDIPQFISLSSWFQGLNTTLGMTYFEGVAHLLSDGQKREFSEKQGQKLSVSQGQNNAITQIIADLKNGNRTPNLDYENQQIFSNFEDDDIETNEFTVDNYIENEEMIECIELKTVRPNAGEMRGEKGKILTAKAALKRRKPEKIIHYYFGFPYDPWSETPTGYNKEKFLREIIEGRKFLSTDEVLLSSELWDHLSDEEYTMERLIATINRIATTDFWADFQFIKDPQNILVDRDRYLEILLRWDQNSEYKISVHYDQIFQTDRNIQKILLQEIFEKDGTHNTNRIDKLTPLI